MTEPLDLLTIRTRARLATPGPWKVWAMEVHADPVGNSNIDDSLLIANTHDPHRGLRTFNAEFMAASRADVPALVDEVERLREEVAARDAVIARVNGAAGLPIDEAWTEIRAAILSAPESVLAARDAEKWDEGQECGYKDAWEHTTSENPYRAGADQ